MTRTIEWPAEFGDPAEVFGWPSKPGQQLEDEPPPPNGPEAYGLPPDGDRGADVSTNDAPIIASERKLPPITLDEWLSRTLPAPDRLMGEWLTTTSRIMISAATGIGKTNLAGAIVGHASAGIDFLHWKAHRPCRALLIDGEMSRRLLKIRAGDIVRRLGAKPDGLFLLSTEDLANFQPLNTPAGRAFLEKFIEDIGGVDFVVFDNIMSLTAGNQKDPDAWAATEPLVNSLTKKAIGQIWIDHAGHDASRGYGSSTKTWRMDTVMHATAIERADTDISFGLEFRKARERTPETRADFENVSIALVNDRWECNASAGRRGHTSPLGAKFLEALQDTFSSVEPQRFQNWPAVRIDDWRRECERRGLLDPDKTKSASALFSKYRRELIAANRIAANDELVWTVT